MDIQDKTIKVMPATSKSINESAMIRGMITRINEIADGGAKQIVITDDKRFGDNTLSSEKEYIVNNMNSYVRFSEKALVFYPDTRDLTFSGEVTDMNNLRFQFRLNDPTGQGVYIWANELQLSEANVKKVQQIHNLFLNWKEKWVKNGKMLDSFVSND